MKESILTGKRILVVGDEPQVLTILEGEVLDACPRCFFEKGTTYKEAIERIASWTYDLVVLDGTSVHARGLLERAALHNFPVVMLTAKAPNPRPQDGPFPSIVRAYLPKADLRKTVPLLEEVLKDELKIGWKGLSKKLKEFFNGCPDHDGSLQR